MDNYFKEILDFWWLGEIFNSNLWAFVEGLITIITLGYVYKSYNENKTQEEDISVRIRYDNGEEKPLTLTIKRKNFTRSEVKGILGDAHNGESYNIEYLNSRKFTSDILDIQASKKKVFWIEITASDVFDLRTN